MTLTFLVYLISILDKAHMVIHAILLIMFITIPWLCLMWGIGTVEKFSTQIFKTTLKTSFIISICSGILYIVLPGEKTAYMMTAAYMTQQIIEKPEAKVLTDKIYTIVNGKLDEYINEIEKNAKH